MPPVLQPQPEIITLEQYEALPEEKRIEVFEGVVYDMASPSRIHQALITDLITTFHTYIQKKNGSCEVFPAPFDVMLSKNPLTIVQPDIMIVDGKRFIATVSPITEDESLTELWEKKSSQLVTIALGVIYMRDLEVFSEDETNKYLSEIVKMTLPGGISLYNAKFAPLWREYILFWQVKVKNRLYFCVYCIKMANKGTKVSVCDFSVTCDKQVSVITVKCNSRHETNVEYAEV